MMSLNSSYSERKTRLRTLREKPTASFFNFPPSKSSDGPARRSGRDNTRPWIRLTAVEILERDHKACYVRFPR